MNRHLPLAIVATTLLGCRDDPQLDTGLVPDDGCLLAPDHFLSVEIEPAEVPTVFHARWSTPQPSQGQVIFSAGDATWQTPLSEQVDTEHETLLVGSPADAEVQVRLISEADGVRRCSDTVTMTTPSPPPELPVMSRDPDHSVQEPQGWALAPFGPSESSIPTLVDSQGRYCWWLQEGGYFFYAAMAPGGQSLLLLDTPHGHLNDARLIEVGLDGQTRSERTIPSGHNDFALVPDGSVMVLGREVYDAYIDGQVLSMTSDTLIELQPDGSQEVVWTAREALWDDLERTISTIAANHDDGAMDWTHGTGLTYDPNTDRLLMSLTYAGVVVALERSTLETAWILGGDASTLEIHLEQGPAVAVPHSVQALDHRVLVYNQRLEREDETCGEATEVFLDLEHGTAETSWVGRAPDCASPDTMGSAHRALDGTTLVAAGTLGRISWFDDRGELIWRLTGELGAAVGGAEQVGGFY